jgi:hypothetical protein
MHPHYHAPLWNLYLTQLLDVEVLTLEVPLVFPLRVLLVVQAQVLHTRYR